MVWRHHGTSPLLPLPFHCNWPHAVRQGNCPLCSATAQKVSFGAFQISDVGFEDSAVHLYSAEVSPHLELRIPTSGYFASRGTFWSSFFQNRCLQPHEAGAPPWCSLVPTVCYGCSIQCVPQIVPSSAPRVPCLCMHAALHREPCFVFKILTACCVIMLFPKT